MSKEFKQDWRNATWIGSRRAMIRQSLKLTVRERLLFLEEMSKTSKKLASIKKSLNQSSAQ